MQYQYTTIGFLGLGLIGGSIARTIRRIHPETVILGYDENKESLELAAAEGVLDKTFDHIDPEFGSCDIIYLCAPVEINISFLPVLKEIISEDCIISDVGSVKEPVQKAVDACGLQENFIGGHPMVGSEKSGYANSNDHLLENAYYFITPSGNTRFSLTAGFQAYTTGLGALVVALAPSEHDFITAAISHVPHIIACELVHLVRRNDNGMLRQLAAGGFKDITRIASSSPIMWEQICTNNSGNIKSLLRDMIADLTEVINELEENHGDYVNEYFREAGEYRSSVPDNSQGLFDKIHKIYVDIPDEPGTLATAASQLAFNNINIKNIGIVHNREFEEGVMEIMLYDEESCEKAAQILESRNYIVHRR